MLRRPGLPSSDRLLEISHPAFATALHHTTALSTLTLSLALHWPLRRTAASEQVWVWTRQTDRQTDRLPGYIPQTNKLRGSFGCSAAEPLRTNAMASAQPTTQHASGAGPRPSSRGEPSRSWVPPIPAPLQRLFDSVPLVTYPPNDLPVCSSAPNDLPTLHVFTSAKDAARGAPSFNPSCLKWQVSAQVPRASDQRRAEGGGRRNRRALVLSSSGGSSSGAASGRRRREALPCLLLFFFGL